MRSSTMPPRSFVSSVYWAPPTSIRSRSFASSPCRSPRARGPSTSISPMCDTSKRPASVRTARCSGSTPAYCTGSSQPANGTIRPPSATCRACNGVRWSVAAFIAADANGGRTGHPRSGGADADGVDGAPGLALRRRQHVDHALLAGGVLAAEPLVQRTPQLTARRELLHDVRTADQLAPHEDLRDRRPARELGELPANLG